MSAGACALMSFSSASASNARVVWAIVNGEQRTTSARSLGPER
jgi:hypothetical protein